MLKSLATISSHIKYSFLWRSVKCKGQCEKEQHPNEIKTQAQALPKYHKDRIVGLKLHGLSVVGPSFFALL